MNCAEYKHQLHDYFHGSLEPEQRAAVEQHASACGPCGDLMRVAREISCKDLVTFLNEYIDDELELERRAVFDRHLGICADCAAYLDSYRKTMSLSALALRGPPLPPKIPEELLKAILAARQR